MNFNLPEVFLEVFPITTLNPEVNGTSASKVNLCMHKAPWFILRDRPQKCLFEARI